MTNLFPELSAGILGLLAFLIGSVAGSIAASWSGRISIGESLAVKCGECNTLRISSIIPVLGTLIGRGKCRRCGAKSSFGRFWIELGCGLAFAVYVVAVAKFNGQKIPTVTPDPIWMYGRIVAHLMLIWLLVAATATDFRDYVIPDAITKPGMILGVLIATGSGDTQIIHLWVDWNQSIPQLRGPFIPEWIQGHRHLHGLGWSVAGLIAGGGLTWLARLISGVMLGQEALGFGDVTLMAMAGCFLGWQPIVFAFMLAPFCGILVGVTAKMLFNTPYVPYGPYLAAAVYFVLIGWQWLWMFEPAPEISVRKLFGDWQGLLILTGIAVAALCLLLGFLRLYRLIPGKRR